MIEVNEVKGVLVAKFTNQDRLNSLINGLEKQLDDSKSNTKNNDCESHLIDTLRSKVCYFLV